VLNDSETRPSTTLAEGLAQHYLPTRPEAKPETEEERKARAEQVRLENRERKKKWREQNADRSILPNSISCHLQNGRMAECPFSSIPSLPLTANPSISNLISFQTKTTTSAAESINAQTSSLGVIPPPKKHSSSKTNSKNVNSVVVERPPPPSPITATCTLLS
jgi:hypothetical protein